MIVQLFRIGLALLVCLTAFTYISANSNVFYIPCSMPVPNTWYYGNNIIMVTMGLLLLDIGLGSIIIFINGGKVVGKY